MTMSFTAHASDEFPYDCAKTKHLPNSFNNGRSDKQLQWIPNDTSFSLDDASLN